MGDKSISEKTLALMDQYDIPVTPDNYKVWYTYVTDENPRLSATLNAFLVAKTVFDQALNENLYREYFTDELLLSVESGCVELERVIGDATDGMASASESLSSYQSLLNAANIEFRDFQKDALENLISKLIASTKATSEEASGLCDLLKILLGDVANIKQQMLTLSRETYKDSLTTIGNRRYFDTRFAELLLLARNRGYGFTLLMIDVDDFKTVNDKYGHKVGDLVLRFVGRLIGQNVKGQDVAARYGGEEFVILLLDTGLDNAKIFANNLRKKICAQDLTLQNKSKNLGRISVSIGVSVYRETDTEDSLFERADKCLYKAKANGKNCVVAEK